jgi:hypothetical protein
MADVNYIEDNKINCKDLKEINQAITDMLNLFMELHKRFDSIEIHINNISMPIHTYTPPTFAPTYPPPTGSPWPGGSGGPLGPGTITNTTGPWSGTGTGNISDEIMEQYKALVESKDKNDK